MKIFLKFNFFFFANSCWVLGKDKKIIKGPLCNDSNLSPLMVTLVSKGENKFKLRLHESGEFLVVSQEGILEVGNEQSELSSFVISAYQHRSKLTNSNPNNANIANTPPQSLLDMSHIQLDDAIHASPSAPDLLHPQNQSQNLLDNINNTNNNNNNFDNTASNTVSSHILPEIKLLQSTKQKSKFSLLIEIIRDLIKQENQTIIFCHDSFFVKKICKTIDKNFGKAKYIIDNHQIGSVCKSICQGEARYLIVSYQLNFSEISKYLPSHLNLFYGAVFFDLPNEFNIYSIINSVILPKIIYGFISNHESPEKLKFLHHFIQHSSKLDCDPPQLKDQISMDQSKNKNISPTILIFNREPTERIIDEFVDTWLLYIAKHWNSNHHQVDRIMKSLSDGDIISIQERIEFLEDLSLDHDGDDIYHVFQILLFYLSNIPNNVIPMANAQKLMQIYNNLRNSTDNISSLQQEINYNLSPMNRKIILHILGCIFHLMTERKCSSVEMAKILAPSIFGECNEKLISITNSLINDFLKLKPQNSSTDRLFQLSDSVSLSSPLHQSHTTPPSSVQHDSNRNPMINHQQQQQNHSPVLLQPSVQQGPLPNYAPHGSRPIASPASSQIIQQNQQNQPQIQFYNQQHPGMYQQPQQNQSPYLQFNNHQPQQQHRPVQNHQQQQQQQQGANYLGNSGYQNQFQQLNMNLAPINVQQATNQYKPSYLNYNQQNPNANLNFTGVAAELRQSAPPPSYSNHISHDLLQLQNPSNHLTASTPISRKREDWELDVSEITFTKKIGTGSFGEVWKGEWAGIVVAIKKISVSQIGEKEKNAFREEINIMTFVYFYFYFHDLSFYLFFFLLLL